MYKIIIVIVLIISLLLYLKFNKKKYIMVICKKGESIEKYKILMEYTVSLAKQLKRELLLQDANDIINSTKWENYFDMNKIGVKELVTYDYINNRVNDKKDVYYVDMMDTLFWTNIKNTKKQHLAIICNNIDSGLEILKSIVDIPFHIEYNLLVYNVIHRIKHMVRKYMVIENKEGYYIINNKYKVRKIHNILKKYTIQTILCKNKLTNQEKLEMTYNIILFSDLFKDMGITDPYLEQIIIDRLIVDNNIN